MHVFVAGATGAIGRVLVPQLIAAGHQVSAITRRADRAEALRSHGVDAVVADVFDGERVAAAVRGAAPDVIIHQLTDLPARMDPWRLTAIYDRNNRIRRDGTRNLLAAARVAGVRRFIVQSMATWYRPIDGTIKEETDPLWTDAPEPIGGAVRTLVEMETAVLQQAASPVVLRYGAFYGPGTWYAVDGEMARMLRARRFPIVGSGSGITSFVHVEDAASAAVRALEATPGIYNVVDDNPAPASEWVPAFAAAVGAPAPRRIPAFLARLALGKALTMWITTMRGASNVNARNALGWRPQYGTWRRGFREASGEQPRT